MKLMKSAMLGVTVFALEPFVAVRYYRFRMPIFHDEIRASGSVVSFGISLRLR